MCVFDACSVVCAGQVWRCTPPSSPTCLTWWKMVKSASLWTPAPRATIRATCRSTWPICWRRPSHICKSKSSLEREECVQCVVGGMCSVCRRWHVFRLMMGFVVVFSVPRWRCLSRVYSAWIRTFLPLKSTSETSWSRSRYVSSFQIDFDFPFL